MIGFPRTYFRWREPGGESGRDAAVVRRGFFKLTGASALASALFLLLLNRFVPIPMGKALFALAALLSFMVVVYLILAIIPPYVVVTGKHISRGINDETDEEWRYGDISYCGFSTSTVDGAPCHAMEIETRKGERSLIRIAPAVSVDALKSFLRAKGVEVTERPAPPTS